jgi:hypothetical protein
MGARPEIFNSRLFLEPGEFKVKPDAIHLIGDADKVTTMYCAMGLTELKNPINSRDTIESVVVGRSGLGWGRTDESEGRAAPELWRVSRRPPTL